MICNIFFLKITLHFDDKDPKFDIGKGRAKFQVSLFFSKYIMSYQRDCFSTSYKVLYEFGCFEEILLGAKFALLLIYRVSLT